MQTLRLNTVLLDDDARAADDLARVALTVDLAETGPGAEHLRVSDLDQVNLVLRAEGLDELDVLRLRARLDEHAQVGLALVERLGALAQAAREAVVHEGVLQDLLDGAPALSPCMRWLGWEAHLKRILDGELALGSLSGNLDLSRGGVDLNFISSVRHPERAASR